jgi:adenine-specific DNA-methyltransferase
MLQDGTITHIFHPNNERLFENASIDIIIFRYCKTYTLEKTVLYNDKLRFITNSNGLVTFNEEPQNTGNVLFCDCFDIYVGIVSGKDEVYKNSELGNISVLNGYDKMEKYIFIENFPCDDERINKHFLNHKQSLLDRGIRKFTEKNWFEWGAPRNMKTIQKNMGKECIYICNLTRHSQVAFMGKVEYFGGGLLLLLPKKNVNLTKIIEYTNSDRFKANFMFSGRFKLGHRQISNSYIPSEYL